MMQESFELAKQSNADKAFFAKLYPFPGTEIKEICEKEQIIENNIHFNENGMPSVNKTKFISKKHLNIFARRIRIWQMQSRLKEGLKIRGVLFLWDVLFFFLYYKPKYDLEQNQMYRWNIDKYKLKKQVKTLS
jgi:hypothetical protein